MPGINKGAEGLILMLIKKYEYLNEQIYQWLLILQLKICIIIIFAFVLNLIQMLQRQIRRKKIIDKFSYISNQIIGEGYSSTVFKGKNQETKQEIAIKVIERNILKYQIHKSMILCEIEFLTILKEKKNILQLVQVINSKQKIYIILQLCSNDLGNQISKRKKIPQAQAIQILKDIINGYKSIWEANILHRDLKPANILRKQNTFIIADFGFALFEKDKKQFEKINVGSPLYMPHQVLGYNQYSYKSDIWAIGVIFYEMLVGNAPWKSKSQKTLFKELLQINIESTLPQGISNSSKQFLLRCLQFDPHKRMSPQELVDFKFEQVFKPLKEKKGQNYKQNMLSEQKMQVIAKPKLKKSNSQYKIINTQQTNQIENVKNQDLSPKPNSQKYIKQDGRQAQNEQQIYGQCQLYQIHSQNMLKKARSKNYQEQDQLKTEQDNYNWPSPNKQKVKKNISRKTSLQVDYEPKPFQLKDIPELKTPQKQIKAKNNQNSECSKKEFPKNETALQQINKQQTFDVMKQFSKELRSQIHYCRFIYKLLIRIMQNTDQKLIKKQLRDQMKLMIFNKLNQISNKKLQNQNIMKQWIETREYDKISKIVIQYLAKYKQSVGQVQDNGIFDQKILKKNLTRSIIKIYNLAYQAYQRQMEEENEQKPQKIKVKRTESSKSTQHEQEDEQSQIMKLKDKIIILDFMITFKQLVRIQERYGWKGFVQKSKIQAIVQSQPLNYIQTHHIEAISQKLQQLKIF